MLASSRFRSTRALHGTPASALAGALGTALILATLLLRPANLTAQAGAATDVLVGRVTDASTGAPVEAAMVSATSLATGLVRSVETGADGRYVLVFADGGGRYSLRVRRLGFTMSTASVLRRAEADRINADFALTTAAAVLDRVLVTAPADSTATGGSGTERTVTQDRVERLPVDNAGDLAAIAAHASDDAVTHRRNQAWPRVG